MNIAYGMHYMKINQLLDNAAALLELGSFRKFVELQSLIESTRQRLHSETPLRIVLIGEFSAGKSSIISALTGEHLHIDADVATMETCEYEWNGITLVDTPGVQADNVGTDHDRIAREATIEADLILFVISNELFNPRLADHFNFVIGNDGLALSKKTAIIVNKIDREDNSDEILIGEIAKVLGNYQEIPVYFCSAAKYRQATQEGSPLRERFERQSRFSTLVEGIDRFIDNAGVTGRISTPISVIEDCLQQMQLSLVETGDDQSKLELIRRQRRVFNKLQQRLVEIRKAWKQQIYSTVISQANDAVEQVSDLSRQEDLEQIFESGLKKADGEIIQLYEGIEIDIREAINRSLSELDEIGDSSLGKKVAIAEMKRAERIGLSNTQEKPDDSTLMSKLAKSSCKPLQTALEGAAQNATSIRDVYYQIGKALGKKFRPWEAVKAGEKVAKTASKLGKVVPIFAAALDFYIQYREEKIKEEKARYLANLRMALHGAFIDQARVETEALERAVLEVSRNIVQDSFDQLNSQEDQISCKSQENKSLQNKITSLRQACVVLRDEIYSGVIQE